MLHLNEVLIDDPGFLDRVNVINLKIDQTPLIIRKHAGSLTFWGREGREQIGLIKRTGMNLYEQAIEHISSRDWSSIPNGSEVHMELFDSRLPSVITYSKPPKNNLIMSLLVQDGEILPSGNTTDALEVGFQPVVWNDIHGKLTNRQKKAIKNADDDVGFAELLDQFAATPFSSARSFILHDFGTTQHEGLVLMTTDNRLAKIVNPAFTAAHKSQSRCCAYTDILTHMMYQHFPACADRIYSKLPFHKSSSETERDQEYIKFIERLCLEMVTYQGELFNHVLRGLEGSENRFCHINYANISVEFFQFINKYWWLEDLFRIMLFEFDAPNKRFPAAVKIYRENTYQTIMNALTARGIVRNTSPWLESIFPFNLKSVPKPSGRLATLLPGRLQPPHAGHYEPLKAVANPVVALITGQGTTAPKSPFSVEIREEMIKKLIPGVEIILADRGYIPTILVEMRQRGLEPNVILAGEDRIADYRRQISKLNWYLLTSKKFNVQFVEMERTGSGTAVRKAITTNDKTAFRKLMPRKLWIYWDQLREQCK